MHHATLRRTNPRCIALLEDSPIDLESVDLVSAVVAFFVPRSNPSSDPVGSLSYPQITPRTDIKHLISPTGIRGGR